MNKNIPLLYFNDFFFLSLCFRKAALTSHEVLGEQVPWLCSLLPDFPQGSLSFWGWGRTCVASWRARGNRQYPWQASQSQTGLFMEQISSRLCYRAGGERGRPQHWVSEGLGQLPTQKKQSELRGLALAEQGFGRCLLFSKKTTLIFIPIHFWGCFLCKQKNKLPFL